MGLRLKRCTGPCGQEKLLDEFWKDPKQADGRQTRCSLCVRQIRAEKAERRRNGEIVPVQSEELKRERSERAKALHADGRLGGSTFGALGGRPRKLRITDVVLEHFRERPELIVRAIESNLRSNNKSHRMRAAEFISDLEQTEDKRLRDARGATKAPDEMSQTELEEFVAQALEAKLESGEIDLASIITLGEGDYVEVTAEQAA